MKPVIALGVVCLGFVLLIASALWPMIFQGSSSWTEEKAVRASEVKARLNNLGPIVNSTKPSMHRGGDLGTLKAEFDALILEEQQLNAEFESARDSPRAASKFLKFSGIGLAILGLAGWYAINQSS